MASTFLVRLKVGRVLVDAKGVNNLYRPVVKGRDIALFVAAMLSSLVLVVAVSEPVRLWFPATGEQTWMLGATSRTP